MSYFNYPMPISFLYDGEPFSELEKTVTVKEEGNNLETNYLLPDGLKITTVQTAYPGHNAIEWVTYYEHTGTRPSGILSDVHDADIELPFDHDEPAQYIAYLPTGEDGTLVYFPTGSNHHRREFWCDTYPNRMFPGGAVRKFSSVGGRSSNGTAPFCHIRHNGKSKIFAIGWSGQWNCMLERLPDAMHVITKLEDTNFRLYPGEKIRTSSFLLMDCGECTFIDAQNAWRRLIKQHYSIIGKEGRPSEGPFFASLWGGMTTEGMLHRIRTIKKENLPMEWAWIDAGWYGTSTEESPDEFEGDWWDYTGDWRVNPHHHPDNMQDVADELQKSGLKMMLWFEPERIRNIAPVAQEHPEYLIGSRTEGDGDMLYNLGNKDAWQLCYDTLSEMIDRCHIQCLRQDFNFNPLPFWRANDSYDRKGMTEIGHIMGLYRLWDALLERFPNFFIDTCASGGRRIDIETLKRAMPLWRSDVQCAANWDIPSEQTHSMTFPMWLPYSGTGTGRALDEYRIRSAYSGSMTTNYSFSERDEYGTPEQMAFIRKYGEEYKTIRPYFYEDFYPLTGCEESEYSWHAFRYHRPSLGDGMVMAFRHPYSPAEKYVFPFDRVDAEARYQITDMDDGSSYELNGKELLENGFAVVIKEQRKAKIFVYKKI